MLLNETFKPEDVALTGSRQMTPEQIVVVIVLSFFCVFGTVDEIADELTELSYWPEARGSLEQVVKCNAMAFFIYFKKREKGTSTIFILSLAVTDLLTCLVVIPFTVASEIIDFHHFYDIVCK
ncbi:hypothetical protein Btru_009620, partial [Bulinus truncatus]